MLETITASWVDFITLDLSILASLAACLGLLV